MFRFFESLIDPFRDHDESMPPQTLGGFYWRYCRQVWPAIACLMAVGLVVSLIEVVDAALHRRARRHAARDEPAEVLRDDGASFVDHGRGGPGRRVRWPGSLHDLVDPAGDRAGADQPRPLAGASLRAAPVAQLFRQ